MKELVLIIVGSIVGFGGSYFAYISIEVPEKRQEELRSAYVDWNLASIEYINALKMHNVSQASEEYKQKNPVEGSDKILRNSLIHLEASKFRLLMLEADNHYLNRVNEISASYKEFPAIKKLVDGLGNEGRQDLFDEYKEDLENNDKGQKKLEAFFNEVREKHPLLEAYRPMI